MASEPSRRRYDDACGTAHGLELLGERWAMLVVRELLLGPKRFSDLRADLPGISANVLTQRLEGLEAAGIVRRRRMPPPTPVQLYELTPWGYEAEPIVCTLGKWAARSPGHDPSLPLSATSLVLSLRTMFAPALAGAAEARIGLELGHEQFLAEVGGGRLTVARGAAGDGAAVIAGAPRALAAAIYGGVPTAALEADGALSIRGDRALAERFLRWFVLPPKAGAGDAAEHAVAPAGPPAE